MTNGPPWLFKRKDHPEIIVSDLLWSKPVVDDSITDEARRVKVWQEVASIIGHDFIEISDDAWTSIMAAPAAGAPPPPPPTPVPPPPKFPTAETTGVPPGAILKPQIDVSLASDLIHWGLSRAVTIDGLPYQAVDEAALWTSTRPLIVDVPYFALRKSSMTATGPISNTSALIQLSGTCKSFLAEDFYGDGGPAHNRIIAGDPGDIVVRRAHLTRFGNAAVEKNDRTGSFSMLVEDSYLHESKGWAAPDHADGLQMGAGKHFMARRNTIVIEPFRAVDGDEGAGAVSNSCVGVWAELGHVTGDVLVEANLLAGGGSILYLQAKAPYTFKGNVTVQGNVFDRRRFPSLGGRAAIWFILAQTSGIPPQLVWASNCWEDGTTVPVEASA